MTEAIKHFVNTVTQPIPYTLLCAALLVFVLVFRKIAVSPIAFGLVCLLGAAFFVFAWPDPQFNLIITKPDNVPIVILLGSVGFFTWLSLRRAVLNDERIKRGEPTLEGELSKQKVFVWPDLVYTELICLVLFTALLLVWSIKIGAPIEEPASQARTPNPSKAPWYFLGLQEMLVYFDPWIAGVLLPGYVIVGLCSVPYLDVNPKGNGYFTFEQRRFAVSFFMVGFLLLWVSLIIMGTFLRGPNWSFFGPFEYWDPHKLQPALNVNLSEFFWIKGLHMPRPDSILLREAPGLLGILFYFVVMPPILGRTVFRRMATAMGTMRFMVMAHFFLWFCLVPLKMVLRWTVNLKYFVGIPEFFFNI
jgi:Cytochrome b(C-terminal)/b6/petD